MAATMSESPQSFSNSSPSWIVSRSSLNISNSWWYKASSALNRLLNYPVEGTSWSPRRPQETVYSVAMDAILGVDSVEHLSIPRMSATSEGGIRIGWRNKDRELDIEIMADGSVEFLSMEHGKKPEEGEIDQENLKATVNKLLRWLMA
jgi:hypothetical protein